MANSKPEGGVIKLGIANGKLQIRRRGKKSVEEKGGVGAASAGGGERKS